MRYILTLLALHTCIAAFAQESMCEEAEVQSYDIAIDTTAALTEVVVMERLTSRKIIDGQKLNGAQIEKLSNNSIADALRYFSGVQVKDYGGVGGLKTVNIRSMGTHHLGIFYDGIELGNAQNGVIDLGQFSLDNVDEISLFNGQKSQIFQPAADFGNAGAVYIRTRRPLFTDGKRRNLRLRLKAGSSDMCRLSGVWDEKITETLLSSLSVGFLTSSGKYKFRYQRQNIDGSIAYDTTATRHNGDVLAVRAEGNLHGVIERGGWNVKLYTYQSSRGIPGAIVNNIWRRGERQTDSNNFLQATWQKSLTDHFDTQLRAKYAYYYTHYINRDTTLMAVDNTFRQQEFYLSSANAYEIQPWWTASLSYDFRWSKLNADTPNFARPQRFTNMLAIATAFDFGCLKMQGSLLGTFTKDKRHFADNESSSLALSTTQSSSPALSTTQSSSPALSTTESSYTPTLFLSLALSKVLTLSAYAKQNYRLPTFNDLYYTNIGNANLKPERAMQYDIGFTAKSSWAMLKIDGYYNTIHDKIVAYPKGQQFRWTMLNLGRVHITGLDVSGEAKATIPCNALGSEATPILLTARLQYTWQRAIDVTDANTSYYHDQIPYIPWHSGSAVLNAEWRALSVNYSFIYAGKRYCQQENIRRNEMLPWYTSDLSISFKHKAWRATLDINNLLSQDYDVIVNYPMPKRNYAVTLSYEL